MNDVGQEYLRQLLHDFFKTKKMKIAFLHQSIHILLLVIQAEWVPVSRT
jgi:hypothetical protein